MGFKLFEIPKPEERDSLELLKDRLIDMNKKKNKEKNLKGVENSDYDEINVISFKRSLYRLKTNYQIKDQKKI